MNKPRGRPFEPGNRLSPGRPKGSRKQSRPGDELLDQFAPNLIGECIRRALKEGDRTALRLCVERVSPTWRGMGLSFKLPTMRSAGDAERAVAKVTQALHRGQCTPAEAIEVMRFLQAHVRLLQDLQFEKRLDRVEQIIKERKERSSPEGWCEERT